MNTPRKASWLAISALLLFSLAATEAQAVTFAVELQPNTYNAEFNVTFINWSSRPVTYHLGDARGQDGSYRALDGDLTSSVSTGGGRKNFHWFRTQGGKTIELGDGFLVACNGKEVRARFWSGRPSGGFDYYFQYINMLNQNGFTVGRDTSELNEVTGNGCRITVDAGGQGQITTRIFVQVYDN